MNEEWIDKFLEKLAEHEGTEGRKVAIEGGKGTRGYGITTIAKGLINFLTLNGLNADEMSDKDLAKQIVIYNIDQIKNSIGEENWNKLPNSMKMVASDQYYNAGKLFPGFKKDLTDGNYKSALKNTLDIVLANDTTTGKSAILNGLIKRRIDWYNIAAQELGFNTINDFSINDSVVEGKKTAINYNYSDGSAFTIDSKADMHSQSLKKTDKFFLGDKTSLLSTEAQDAIKNVRDSVDSVSEVTGVQSTDIDQAGNFLTNFISDLQGINEKYKVEGKTELEQIENEYLEEQEDKAENEELFRNSKETFRIANEDDIRAEIEKQNLELQEYDPLEGHKNPTFLEPLPDVPFVSKIDQFHIDKANEEYNEELEKETSLWNIAGAAKDMEWVSSWLLKHADREDLNPNHEWTISDFVPNKEQTSEILKGVNPEFHAEIIESGKTLPEMKILANKYLDVQEKEKILMSHGVVTGVTARLLAAVLDPSAIMLAIATDGLMAPVIIMNKANRLQRIIRGGFAAATTNAAIEGFLVTQNPTLDLDDVLIATAAGFVLGGTIRGIRKTKIDEDEAALNKAVDDFKNAKEKELIDDSGLKLTEKGNKKYKKVKTTAQDEYDEAALKYDKTILERTTGRADGNTEIRMPDGKDKYIVTKDGKVIKCGRI
tara:strand:- start:2634 stop:4607 length:1974 start_codon:yes stop_codon:yes gene_type:complete